MRKLQGFIVASFALALASNASADIVESVLPGPFPVSSISSDFGPRNVATGSRFHEGVDYSQDAGTPIPIVESATLTDIDFNTNGYGWRVYAKNGSSREWRYAHMFGNPGVAPKTSGEFELRKVEFHDDIYDPTIITDTRYVIIRWKNKSENRAYSVISSRAGFAVPNGALGDIKDESGSVVIKATTTLSDFVGPVGNSGIVGIPPHLDLGFNRQLNPLMHVAHEPPDSAYTMRFLAPQSGGTVFHFRSDTVNKESIVVEIDSKNGLDLDVVEYYVAPVEMGAAINDAYRLTRYSYAGRWGRGDRLNSSVLIGNLNTTGVGPIAGSPGLDRFVYWGWNSREIASSLGSGEAAINAQAKWPDGEYNLRVKTFDVNGHVVNDGTKLGEHIDFSVDNFRPYAEFVEVKDAQGDVKYRRSWTLKDGVLRSEKVEADEPLLPGGEYTVTALFSEFMEWGQLQVESLAPMNPVETPLPALKKTIYTGSFTLGAGQDRDELRPLIITGRDIGANDVLKLDPGKRSGDGREDPERTINPALELTRNDAGDMQGIGGEDRFHTLRIDAASPVISYNKQSKRYSAFDYTCPGGVPERCGTEEAPIYITFSSVPFLYTDLGSGIGSVTVYKERLGGELVFPLESSPALAGGYSSGLTLPLKDGKYVQVVTDNLGRGT